MTISAAKGMQEAFVRVDVGGEGNDGIFFDGCSTVFIGDVSQPHSASKSGIKCPIEQFRTYMSGKQMSKRKRKLEISNESLKMMYFFIHGQTNALKMEKHSFQREVTKAVYGELEQQVRNADITRMERVERFASGGQTMEDFVALDYYSIERGARISPQADTFQFIFLCATRKLCNVLSIEANKGYSDSL